MISSDTSMLIFVLSPKRLISFTMSTLSFSFSPASPISLLNLNGPAVRPEFMLVMGLITPWSPLFLPFPCWTEKGELCSRREAMSNVSFVPPLLIMLITTALFGFFVGPPCSWGPLKRCGAKGCLLSTRNGDETKETWLGRGLEGGGRHRDGEKGRLTPGKSPLAEVVPS